MRTAIPRFCKPLLGIVLRGVLVGALYLAGPQLLYTGAEEPPRNFVAVTDTLATSGQPSAAQLRRLGEEGYALVVNLAPPHSFGSLADEAGQVAAQGIAYVNIPVAWEAPAARDFALFGEAVKGHRERKTLVHCQLNMRASGFTFLHRVIHEQVPVEEALEKLHGVRVPNDTWTAFLVAHGVPFDPLLFAPGGE